VICDVEVKVFQINMSKKDVKDSAQVGDSYCKLYSELPKNVFKNQHPVDRSDGPKGLKEFLKASLPQSEQKEIDAEFKKTLSLTKGRKAKKLKTCGAPKRKVNLLSAKERRRLGLNRLPKRGLNFEDFHSMHDLWLEYMRKVVGNAAQKGDPGDRVEDESTVRTLGDEQLQMRISRADLHGAFIKIVRSTNKKMVGLEGYLVMETRNTFQVVTRKSVRKVIPKSGVYFTFSVDQLLFTIDGSTMCMKPSDRAVKKWKNKPPLDIII